MTKGVIVAISLNSLLYAATAYVLCLSGREFGLYNLAAGAWVVIGGWFTAWLLGPMLGAAAPINPLLFLLLPVVAAVQVLSPLILRDALSNKRLIYLFISLGVALILSAFGQVYLLQHSADTIPVQASSMVYAVSALLLFLILFLVTVMFSTQFWAKTVLIFRLGQPNTILYSRLVFLLLLEGGLLFILGGISFYIHKGQFGEAEYRTVVPILALVLAKSNPIRSFLIAFIVVIAGHLIEAKTPYFAGHSVSITIGLLILAVLFWSWPWDSVVDANKTGKAPMRRATGRLTNDSSLMGVVGIGILIALSRLIPGSADEPLNRFVLMAVLSTAAWFAMRYLDIRSLTWTPLAAICVYAILNIQSSTYLMLALAAAGLFWVFYLWTLRVLKDEPSFVVDLSLVICLYEIAQKSTAISGVENVRAFSSSYIVPIWMVLSFQSILIAGMLSLVFVSARYRRLRSVVLGLGNFRLGWHNGLPVRSLFALGCLILIVCCVAANIGYHMTSAPITPSDLSLSDSLMVFLFGYLMLYWEPGPTYVLMFLIYYVLGKSLASHGLRLEGYIGIALLATVLILHLMSKVTARHERV